jgi:hypothetical protein
MDGPRDPEDRAATRGEVATGDSYSAPVSTLPAPRSTTYRHNVRYFEVDQQGVMFNMWFLALFKEAMFAFFEEGGRDTPRSAMPDTSWSSSTATSTGGHRCG